MSITDEGKGRGWALLVIRHKTNIYKRKTPLKCLTFVCYTRENTDRRG